MAEATTRSEAREAIRESLLAHRKRGVKDPMIPVYDSDVNQDGKPDIFGLDAHGRLELRPDATIADTVSVSDGTGVEAFPDGV